MPGPCGRPSRGQRKSALSGAFSLELVAEWTGLEPATSGVTGQHSNRLNYHSAEPEMIQELSSFLQHFDRTTTRIGIGWWVLRGSNPRPSPCKGDALPLS